MKSSFKDQFRTFTADWHGRAMVVIAGLSILFAAAGCCLLAIIP